MNPSSNYDTIPTSNIVDKSSLMYILMAKLEHIALLILFSIKMIKFNNKNSLENN